MAMFAWEYGITGGTVLSKMRTSNDIWSKCETSPLMSLHFNAVINGLSDPLITDPTIKSNLMFVLPLHALQPSLSHHFHPNHSLSTFLYHFYTILTNVLLICLLNKMHLKPESTEPLLK